MALPKLTKELTPEQKLKLIDEAAPASAAALASKQTNGKPWELVSPKAKKSVSLHIPGDIAAKLEFVYQNADGRPSKTTLINMAIEEFVDKWLHERGLI